MHGGPPGRRPFAAHLLSLFFFLFVFAAGASPSVGKALVRRAATSPRPPGSLSSSSWRRRRRRLWRRRSRRGREEEALQRRLLQIFDPSGETDSSPPGVEGPEVPRLRSGEEERSAAELERWHEDPDGVRRWSSFLGAEGEANVTEDLRHPINAVVCRGLRCHSLSAHFMASRNLSRDPGADFWTHWIGGGERPHEDDPQAADEYLGPKGVPRDPSFASCGHGFVVSALECDYEDCSNLRLRCGVPNATLWTVSDSDRVEMGAFTTDYGNEHHYSTCGGLGHMDRYVLYGIRCAGEGDDVDCSEKRLLCKKVKEAPRDCAWSAWSTWGPCSESCGGGFKKRGRKGENQTVGGLPCGGPGEEQIQCNAFPCLE